MKLISRNIAVLLLLASGLAMAGSEIQKIAEVGGEITIDSDGKIRAISFPNIKNPKLENYLTEKVKLWKFYPVEINGKPVEATSKFSFNLIATYLTDNKLKQIEFANIEFESSVVEVETKKSRTGFKSGKRMNFIYPFEAEKVRAEAIVIIALDITADGKVKNADVSSIELINTEGKSSKFLANEFSKETLRTVRKFVYSKDELADFKCTNGCIGSIKVTYINSIKIWKSYERVLVAPIPWVVAGEIKNLNETEKSQLVRLKENPADMSIETGS